MTHYLRWARRHALVLIKVSHHACRSPAAALLLTGAFLLEMGAFAISTATYFVAITKTGSVSKAVIYFLATAVGSLVLNYLPERKRLSPAWVAAVPPFAIGLSALLHGFALSMSVSEATLLILGLLASVATYFSQPLQNELLRLVESALKQGRKAESQLDNHEHTIALHLIELRTVAFNFARILGPIVSMLLYKGVGGIAAENSGAEGLPHLLICAMLLVWGCYSLRRTPAVLGSYKFEQRDLPVEELKHRAKLWIRTMFSAVFLVILFRTFIFSFSYQSYPVLAEVLHLDVAKTYFLIVSFGGVAQLIGIFLGLTRLLTPLSMFVTSTLAGFALIWTFGLVSESIGLFVTAFLLNLSVLPSAILQSRMVVRSVVWDKVMRGWPETIAQLMLLILYHFEGSAALRSKTLLIVVPVIGVLTILALYLGRTGLCRLLQPKKQG